MTEKCPKRLGQRLLGILAWAVLLLWALWSVLAILLTAIAVGGLTYQSSRKMLGRFGLDSILIAVTYVAGMILLLMEAG